MRRSARAVAALWTAVFATLLAAETQPSSAPGSGPATPATAPDTTSGSEHQAATVTPPPATSAEATVQAMIRPPESAPAGNGATAARATESAPAASRAADDHRPNIILITAADLPLHLTGLAPRLGARTPRLEALAARGATFTRCYTPTPQAAPAQACLLTGLYPPVHGVTAEGRAPGPGMDAFTSRLSRAGYTCAFVGRWAIGGGEPGRPGFGMEGVAVIEPAAMSWLNCPVHVRGNRGVSEGYLTDWLTDRALDVLRTAGGRPFFLWVAYPAPALPAEAPPGTGDLYPPASLELPANTPGQPHERKGNLAQHPSAMAFRSAGESELRSSRSAYLATITHLDGCVGRLLDGLEAAGLSDETAVLFTAESGVCLGERGLLGKGPFFYDETIRVPLVLTAARVPAGRRIERVVSLVDVAPTLLAIAGAPSPARSCGRSLLGLIAEPGGSWPDEAFLACEESPNPAGPPLRQQVRGLVTRQYKLIDYTGLGLMAFALHRDPAESFSVTEIAQYAQVVQVLQARLTRWRTAIKDTDMPR